MLLSSFCLRHNINPTKQDQEVPQTRKPRDSTSFVSFPCFSPQWLNCPIWARIKLHIEPPLTVERELCLPNSCLSQSGGWEPRGQHASKAEFLLNVHFLVCRRLPYYHTFWWSLVTSSPYSLLMGAPLSWLFQNPFPIGLVSKCHTLGTRLSKYVFVWNQQTLIPKPFPSFIACLLLTFLIVYSLSSFSSSAFLSLFTNPQQELFFRKWINSCLSL